MAAETNVLAQSNKPRRGGRATKKRIPAGIRRRKNNHPCFQGIDAEDTSDDYLARRERAIDSSCDRRSCRRRHDRGRGRDLHRKPDDRQSCHDCGRECRYRRNGRPGFRDDHQGHDDRHCHRAGDDRRRRDLQYLHRRYPVRRRQRPHRQRCHHREQRLLLARCQRQQRRSGDQSRHHRAGPYRRREQLHYR